MASAEVIDLTKEESPPTIVVVPPPPSRPPPPPPTNALCLTKSDNAIVTPNVIGFMTDAFQDNRTVVHMKANDMLHIQQMDKWSCGYRNLQMVLSSLLPELPRSHPYFTKRPASSSSTTSTHTIPDIPQLQRQLEQAWSMGWDPNGAQHYNHKLVAKTAKIGAVEVSTCLSSMGIDNTIVQFIKCRQSRSQLGDFCRHYFASTVAVAGGRPSQDIVPRLLALSSDSKNNNNNNNRTNQLLDSGPNKKPLYLQWDGHSVCVVGVELADNNNKTGRVKHLLALDPLLSGTTLRHALARRQSQPLRLSMTRLLRRDCQVIVVTGIPDRVPPPDGVIAAVTAAPEAVLRWLPHDQTIDEPLTTAT